MWLWRIHSAGLAQNQIKLQEFYLPAGKYERIKWTISETNLKKDGKIFSLATPQPGGNHFFDMEFSVFSGESFAIFADWNPEESVFDKYLFKPKMTLRKQGIEIKNILLYVTNSDSNCVTVIDRQHDRVVAAIAVNQSPMGIVASPDGNKIYVANSGSNNISVIDTGLNRVINTIGNFGYSPAELALSGDGLTLYATNPNSNNISVIDTLSNIVTGWIYVGNDPADIVVDQDRCKVYVVNKASNSVSIVNVNTSAVENTVPICDQCRFKQYLCDRHPVVFGYKNDISESKTHVACVRPVQADLRILRRQRSFLHISLYGHDYQEYIGW